MEYLHIKRFQFMRKMSEYWQKMPDLTQPEEIKFSMSKFLNQFHHEVDTPSIVIGHNVHSLLAIFFVLVY